MQPAKGTEAANLLKMCLQMPICLHKPHGYRAAEERAVLLHFPWDCQKKKKKIAMAAVKLKSIPAPPKRTIRTFLLRPQTMGAKQSQPHRFIFCRS